MHHHIKVIKVMRLLKTLNLKFSLFFIAPFITSVKINNAR